MMKYVYLLLAILFIFFSTIANAQVGTPPMQSFAPSEYNGTPDIRSILQSKRGLLYVGSSNSNILEYDGLSWKSIPIPCQYPNTLVEDDNGNLFFGDMFFTCAAYLRPDKKTGKWETVPIRFDLPDSVYERNDFKAKVHKVNGEIYYVLFSSPSLKNQPLVHKFENGKFIPLPITSDVAVHPTQLTSKGIFQQQVEGTTYLLDWQTLKQDSLHIDFRQLKYIYNVKDFSTDEVLLLTLFNGLWKYNIKTHQLTFFGDENTKTTLGQAQPLNMSRLNNGNWVIGTVKNGLFVLDSNGIILKNISTKEGLRDNIVMFSFEDNQNQLWTALYNGISRIDINAPIGVWTKDDGILGSTTQNIVKFEDTYFACTITNILYYDNIQNTWKPVKNTDIENYLIHPLTLSDGKQHLFAGHIHGMYELVKNGKEWTAKPVITSKAHIRVIGATNHKNNPDKIYVNNRAMGLNYIMYDSQNENLQLHDIASLKNNRFSQYNMIFTDDAIWMNSYDHIRPVKFSLIDEKLDTFPIDSALAISFQQQIFLIKASGDSIFNIQSGNKIAFDTTYSALIQPYGSQPLGLYMDRQENLWIYSPFSFLTHVLRKTTNGYQRDKFLEQALGKYVVRDVYTDPDDNQIIWLSTSEGVVRVDMSKSEVQNNERDIFHTHIRQIKIGKDSLIFEGNFMQVNSLDNDSLVHVVLNGQKDKDILELDFRNNSIAFQVAAPFFIEEKQIQFAYFLEGLDENWSEWTSLNLKEYTNLPTGKYIFKAKAKNYLGQESEITMYRFEVFPPWYKTTPAYLMYGIFFIGLIWGSTRIYTHRLRQQNEHLESLVRERTDQIMQVNAELQQQNEEIAQQRDQLDEKNQQIAEQNTNIVSSINYAKRIQTALLPFDERLKEDLPAHFIFYQPRDIVSGDFYWIEKVENKVIIAVADCTGHGVPGAFMAMLGSSGLTDAVFQQKLIEPHLILKHLHTYISKALKQEKSDNRDGMDVAIVVWDKDNQQLHYAGAMNPIYYVQNEELLQIKADKVPIGGTVAKAREYTPHVINLHTPTTIYLASDGYQDQFGGKDGRKFMTKQFKALLLEISHLPMQEQQQRLAQVLERWRGHERQIDDVLVFGMSV